MNPWVNKEENKIKAERHIEHVEKYFPSQIKNSIENSTIYDSTGKEGKVPIVSNPIKSELGWPCEIALTNKTSNQAAFELGIYKKHRNCVLNFASYKNCFEHVIFAIPDETSPNFLAFKEVLDKELSRKN